MRHPDHLFLGTHQDNSDDCAEKGRKARGSRVGVAKLTETQVLEIRERYANWETLDQIANRFRIAKPSVTQIVRGVVWKHVGGPTTRPPRSGLNNPAAKLSDHQKVEIIERYRAGGITQQQLADEYDVCFQRISQLIRRGR